MRPSLRFQVLLVSILLTLCNFLYARAEPLPVRKVVLQLRWDHQFQFAGYYAAKWQGYYREAGLDVEIRSAITPDHRILKAVEEVREKRADFGIGGSDILAANDRFGDFAVLASIFQQSAARIYALKAAQLNSPADLAGKRVARNKGDLIDVEMQVMLKAEGIDQSKLVSVPLSPTIEGLKRGEIDAMPGYSMSLPYDARLAGIELSSLNPSTYGVDFYGDSLFTLTSRVNDNSTLVESFVSATLKGWEYALTHQDEIIQRIVTELPRAVPIEDAAAFNRFQAEGVKKLIMYPAVELGHINPARWERMHKALRDTGLISGSLDISSFIYDAPHRATRKIGELRKTIVTMAAVASVGLVVIVLWTVMLRRQVRAKTDALMESQRFLRESEEKFSRLFAFDPLPKAVTRLETGEFLEVNDRLTEVLGYSRDELIGKTSLELGLITTEKRQLVLDIVLSRGRVKDLALQITNRDGSVVDALYYAEVLTLNGERRLLSSFQDITERKLAEEQLASEKRFIDDVIDGIQDLFYAFDLNGRMLRWNSKLAQITGYSNDEIAGMSPVSFFAGDDIRRVSEAIRTTVETGYASVTAKLVCKDGTTVMHEFNGSLLLDRHRLPFGICGVGRDISERQKLELFRDANRKTMELLLTETDTVEALHGVVSLLTSTLGFDAVGIRLQSGDDFPYLAGQGFTEGFLAKENCLVMRDEGEGIYCNEEGQVYLECTCGLVLTGRTDPRNPLLTEGGSFWINDSRELLDLPPDQDPRLNPRNECIQNQYASIALVPIRTSSNAIIGLLQLNDHRKGRFSHDSIAELENIAAHLGERIARGVVTDEKNALQDQLVQSQKLEAIGQLAGGVAHDFNNILTVIKGYCKLLDMDKSLSNEQQAYLSEIDASAERAAQLTQGLLAFSHKQVLAMRPENLNDIIHHVHKFLARVIGEDIQFNSICCAPDLPIVADLGQIEQVLINLATNARDAMPDGGVFTIKSELVALGSFFYTRKNTIPPGRYALLTVSDTGAGIREEHLDHIFEPFFTTKAVGKGTGLGMAIIYGIIKQHNGFITVSSKLGQGTTFQIYLPLQEGSGSPQDEKEQAEPLRGGNETILVAEDDPTVRSLVSQILSIYGYETILAEDGEDAITQLTANSERVALVLMDVIMPKKNGREAFEEIRRIRPDIKVLFTSGYTSDFIESRGLSEQGIELIMKPVQPTALLKKVREVLDA